MFLFRAACIDSFAYSYREIGREIGEWHVQDLPNAVAAKLVRRILVLGRVSLLSVGVLTLVLRTVSYLGEIETNVYLSFAVERHVLDVSLQKIASTSKRFQG